MKCWFCDQDARGTCAACGRGLCRQHAHIHDEMTIAKTPGKPDETIGEKIDDASITAQVKSSLPAATATFGVGMYCSANLVVGSSRVVGITFPANGTPENGSITSTHRRAAGLAWQNAELRG